MYVCLLIYYHLYFFEIFIMNYHYVLFWIYMYSKLVFKNKFITKFFTLADILFFKLCNAYKFCDMFLNDTNISTPGIFITRIREMCQSCQTWPAKFGQILLRTDTRLVYFAIENKWGLTLIFTRTIKPTKMHMQFREPCRTDTDRQLYTTIFF